MKYLRTRFPRRTKRHYHSFAGGGTVMRRLWVQPSPLVAILHNWRVFDECWRTIQSIFLGALAKKCWVSNFSFRDSRKSLAFSLSPYDPKRTHPRQNDAKRFENQFTFQKYRLRHDSTSINKVIARFQLPVSLIQTSKSDNSVIFKDMTLKFCMHR